VLSGNAGPASWWWSEIGASTYAGTPLMILLACRASRFSTEEAKFFWQTEMKFVACRTPNSKHGFLKTSLELRKEILGVIGKSAWSERQEPSARRALPDTSRRLAFPVPTCPVCVYQELHGLTFAVVRGCRFAHGLASRLPGESIFMSLPERRTQRDARRLTCCFPKGSMPPFLLATNMAVL
jgi:hypothetical protein